MLIRFFLDFSWFSPGFSFQGVCYHILRRTIPPPPRARPQLSALPRLRILIVIVILSPALNISIPAFPSNPILNMLLPPFSPPPDQQNKKNLRSPAQVTNAQDACKVLMKGYASRHTASTAMNSASSRSHAVFTLVIDTAVQLAPVGGGDDEEGAPGGIGEGAGETPSGAHTQK